MIALSRRFDGSLELKVSNVVPGATYEVGQAPTAGSPTDWQWFPGSAETPGRWTLAVTNNQSFYRVRIK